MTLFEDTNPRELKELLSQIHSKVTALPDFQRDFVWDPAATQELIVSIASSFPAGSLLRIRNTHNLFAAREFQGAPRLDGSPPAFLVLDGQQRLTSLYQAFYGVGEHRFFLRLGQLMDGLDFEEAVFHLRASTKQAKRLESFEVQADELILPLSVLKGGTGGFGQWTLKVAKGLAAKGQAEGKALERIEALGEIQENWIQPIDDYHFPVVTLSDTTGADAVCTIFETLNRTGVKLSVFELLTARFWPHNVNLRQLWDAAKESYPIIEDFEVDPYYVLQIISLVARSSPSCKRSDVLNIQTGDISEHWHSAVKALDNVLRLLKEDCGVIVPKWLPYYTILVPFSAILTKRPLPVGPAAAVIRDKLLRWYWCSIFGQAYENAPNSQSAKDVNEVVVWLNGGASPETIATFRFDPRLLRDITPRQRALYRGAISLVLRGGPRDFHKGELVSGDLIVERHIDDHHIFPDSFLRKNRKDVAQRQRDCVLNRTLIDRETNQRISDRPPSDYLDEIRMEFEKGKVDFTTLLASHFISSADTSPIWSDNFERFLDLRQEALWTQVQKVTGVEQASDLLEEIEA